MKKNTLIILLFFAVVSTSCKKLLDITETDAIAGDVALVTVANNQQAVIGAYSAMNVEMGILLNSVLSDEVKVGEFYNSATCHEWQYGTTDVTIRDNFTAVTPFYRVIDRVNRVLAALPTATVSTATPAADEALRLRLKGEALFLRAYCHFELYRFYSNSSNASDLAMQYMEKSTVVPQERLTVGAYFQKLKADLVAAKPLLPAATTDIYRATSFAASAVQARVALYLKEYADAVTYSSEYITAIPLSTRTNFPNIWIDASNAEQAFKLSRTTSIGAKIGSLYRGTSASTAAIGTITWLPSDKLWNSYDQVNDIRFSSYFKTEALLIAPRPNKLITKYAGTTYATPGENVADGKVFRTGEMYLIRAEAKAEQNDLAGATTDINTLRAARINAYVNVANFADNNTAITAIMNERFKELPFEGHRFWDLKRKNLAVQRLSADAPNANATTLAAGNFRFLLPIPNVEMQANPLMKQNPGYN